MTSQAPTLFDGRYRLEGEIGQGGMAVVYRAHDERLNRPVAIKMLRPQFAGDQNFLTRFRREAQAVAILSHPNLAAVWDTGEVNGVPYIVMELVDGDNLKTRIASQAPFTAERAVGLMIQICEGVGAAHRAGVVHRDLKPQNILLTRTGQIKVTDFGIARSLATTSTTQTGPVWGTAQYIAPEQAAGQTVSPATDVYSLGIILYEMVTARLPFEADTPLALAMQHLQAEPPPIRTYNPSVPVGLEHIITKAMAKKPQARYPDADALCSALKAYQRLGEQMTGPIPVIPRQAATPTPAAGSAPTRAATSGARGPAGATVAAPQYAPPTAPPQAEADWPTLLLGAVAALFVLGLIPLYWTVIQKFAGG